MSDNRKRPLPQDAAPQIERRRKASVVHDDRGNASIEWRAASADQERPVLEVQGEARLALKREEISYDPYSSRGQPRSGGTRTDLRRLSEWIKLMRELEGRKRNDDED